MQEYTFVVPATYNNGSQVTQEHRSLIERTLCEVCGGFTRQDNLTGGWLDPFGNVQIEQVSRYSVGTDRPEDLFDTITWIGKLLGQHSMYLVEPGGLACLVETWK